jgi:hypothetical protein
MAVLSAAIFFHTRGIVVGAFFAAKTSGYNFSAQRGQIP